MLPDVLCSRLALPVVAAPMFIVSGPELVVAQCISGVIGSFPALNARPVSMLDDWLAEISERLADHDATADSTRKSAPFAVNLIVHKRNARIEDDLEQCVRHRVPLVITSLGAREDVNEAVHSYGGIVLHDVINDLFAHKAIEKGADGLVAVAAGAGGHAGALSPFALVQEIRQWFDGPLLLSGAIAHGRSILAAQAAGADLAYVGSAFISAQEANAAPEYKQCVVESTASDIVYSNYFTGVHGNFLRSSIAEAGLDPDSLPTAAGPAFGSGADESKPKAWSQIWGSGQGIGVIDKVESTAAIVERMRTEYEQAVDAITASAWVNA
ncbi:NAD(P)H-dependent flavin oxidoreductase [Nocardia niigatensis]|uniref:NAD(P)H-dependent flavin oxidoreductase n=1 Tax=Nocardia niigatensis TaxID=209249 RepID=UPI0002E1032E|nr:nitronate monooxygenase family protein [Nocardia niigatensis]